MVHRPQIETKTFHVPGSVLDFWFFNALSFFSSNKSPTVLAEKVKACAVFKQLVFLFSLAHIHRFNKKNPQRDYQNYDKCFFCDA